MSSGRQVLPVGARDYAQLVVARDVRAARRMTQPRPVFPGRFHMLTRNCTQRMFLLRPDNETNNAFLYCLGEALERFQIELVLPSAMSNHHHTHFFDRHGRWPQFVEHFHRMLARCMNAYRGRTENFWSSEPPCVTELVDPSDVIDKIVYAATNPVKDGLVAYVHQWPGVNGLAWLLSGRPVTAKRPRWFFSRKSRLPATVTLRCVIPPELGDEAAVRELVRARVRMAEAEFARRRAVDGRRVLGRRSICRQSWKGSPELPRPMRRIRPKIAARNSESRVGAINELRTFVLAYRRARAAWLRGQRVPFPIGTYRVHRFLGVPIVD